MIPVTQTIIHDPKNGLYGNCAQAAMASLFELSINEVPHFGDQLKDDEGDEFNNRVNIWLSRQGLGEVRITILPEYIDAWCEYASKICNYHLIAGWTELGTYHVCVGKGGKVIFDPHPSNAGLLEPTADKPIEFDFIIKRF